MKKLPFVGRGVIVPRRMAFTISPVDVESRKNLDLRPGDTVRVHQKIEEKGKTRIQIFEGLVLARKHGTEAGGTFTVRRVSSGVGIEKIFPLYTPMIDKIEVVKRAIVRRAKLYYIREKVAREARRVPLVFENSGDQLAFRRRGRYPGGCRGESRIKLKYPKSKRPVNPVFYFCYERAGETRSRIFLMETRPRARLVAVAPKLLSTLFAPSHLLMGPASLTFSSPPAENSTTPETCSGVGCFSARGETRTPMPLTGATTSR
ncbi:MAG: large subunit ribosomal protein L19 [Parcubacteria group bacterium Athens0416_74]|nr:MAG: large subunit ribosomal protein L19 [Parcubacteria group bacterium Athens0416_74]